MRSHSKATSRLYNEIQKTHHKEDKSLILSQPNNEFIKRSNNISNIYAPNKNVDELKEGIACISKRFIKSISAKKSRCTNNNSQKLSRDEEDYKNKYSAHKCDTERTIGYKSKTSIKSKKTIDSIDLHNTSRELEYNSNHHTVIKPKNMRTTSTLRTSSRPFNPL